MPAPLTTAMDRVPAGPWGRVWGLAAALLVVVLLAWEGTLRARGYGTSVDDDPSLWALVRLNAPKHDPQATTLVGTSRMATGVDLDVWHEVLGGTTPTDLTIYATSALPVLRDLVDDPSVQGTVLLEISEGMLFAESPDLLAQATLRLRARDDMQASLFGRFEKAGVVTLQSHLRLTHPQFDLFDSTRAVLTGAWPTPTTTFRADRKRQLLGDAVGDFPDVPMPDEAPVTQRSPTGDRLLNETIDLVQALQARGVQVILVHLPARGLNKAEELLTYPRPLYWDVLVQRTGALAIHSDDDPVLSRFRTVDHSHLSATDAVPFTRRLAERVRDASDP